MHIEQEYTRKKQIEASPKAAYLPPVWLLLSLPWCHCHWRSRTIPRISFLLRAMSLSPSHVRSIQSKKLLVVRPKSIFVRKSFPCFSQTVKTRKKKTGYKRVRCYNKNEVAGHDESSGSGHHCTLLLSLPTDLPWNYLLNRAEEKIKIIMRNTRSWESPRNRNRKRQQGPSWKGREVEVAGMPHVAHSSQPSKPHL